MSVKEVIDGAEFQRDSLIDEVNLSASFMNQAGLYAHYASLHRQALVQLGQKKLLADTTYSKIYNEIRANAEKESKKVTEAAIEALIQTHKDYVATRMDLIAAEGIESLTRNALESLKQRKDMLIQLGADARQEATGEMRMMASSGSTPAIEAYKRSVGNA